MSAVSTYAEALYEAAREGGELEEVLAELKEFDGALNEVEELSEFFYSPQITEREKRQALDELARDMTDSARNFLKVLSDNGRSEIFPEVLRRYEVLVEEHFGRVEVEVITAVELSEDMQERVKERLGKILDGKEVVLETRVDPDIMGGVVFRFGGILIDSSVRGRLNGLRQEMIERSVVSG
ncbi:MAG: ATP synthase F1 subunit delta [Rubrobacteraceae bacterium]